jgi:hypothetical protein
MRSRHRTGRSRAVLLGVLLAGSWSAQAAATDRPGETEALSPASMMRFIAAEPFRYGGSLQGTVPGVAGAVDQPPIHLAIGLGTPGPGGRLDGGAILFTTDRHLVGASEVTGHLKPGPTAGTGACVLHLTVLNQPITLSGLCTADTLSGEIVIGSAPAGPLTRLFTWWADRTVSGRYWLTPASFDLAAP